jgi:hypothetical protein
LKKKIPELAYHRFDGDGDEMTLAAKMGKI